MNNHEQLHKYTIEQLKQELKKKGKNFSTFKQYLVDYLIYINENEHRMVNSIEYIGDDIPKNQNYNQNFNNYKKRPLDDILLTEHEQPLFKKIHHAYEQNNSKITFEGFYQAIAERDSLISKLNSYNEDFRQQCLVLFHNKEKEIETLKNDIHNYELEISEKDSLINHLKLAQQSKQQNQLPNPDQNKKINVGIIKSDDTFDVIEMKLVSNNNYKPIIDCITKKYPLMGNSFGIRLMKEYCRFVTIKIMEKDCNNNLLLPPPFIEEFWKLHVMNAVTYQEFNEKMGISLYFYQSDKDEAIRITKYQNSIISYQKYFGVLDSNLDIWELYLNKENQRSTQPSPVQKNIATSSTPTSPIQISLKTSVDPDEVIFLSLVDENQETTSFKIKRSTPFSKLMEKFQVLKGKKRIIYSFGGVVLNPNSCPLDFGLESYDTLTCKYILN